MTFVHPAAARATIEDGPGGLEIVVPGARRPFLIGGGRIAFDYGAKTVHFASAVDEAEAKLLIERLRARHPLLRPT
jgi:hypothetical protein